MVQVIDAIAIIAAGMMVGNELAVAAFVHPAFDRLPDSVHIPSAATTARRLGRVMPFWYALVLLLTAADLYARWHASKHVSSLVATSALLWAAGIVYTLAALVPINNRVSSWTRQPAPPNWRRDRHRWDVLHRWRVLLLFAAFATLVVGTRPPVA